jgi:hypothetical protein
VNKRRVRKPHKDRSKFRKNSYSNVDYDDREAQLSIAGSVRRKYRMSCIKCGCDRGYQRNVDALRHCKKCRDKSITFYTPEQKRLRCAMKANLSARLKQRIINKNRKSTFDVLGYTIDEFVAHIESLFHSGMTWNNYGFNGWEIDHITPDSLFKYNSFNDQGFKDSWALSNLQPMWATDNRSKGNRVLCL